MSLCLHRPHILHLRHSVVTSCDRLANEGGNFNGRLRTSRGHVSESRQMSCVAKRGAIHRMTTARVEELSDAVIAIIITIMVLEFRAPHEAWLAGLRPLLPVLASYVLSFISWPRADTQSPATDLLFVNTSL